MTTPLPVVMLGGGLTSAIGRTHTIAMRLDGRFELVGGCFSRSGEVNARSAAAYGVPPARTFADLDALLDGAGDVGTLVVATPIQQHARQIGAALDRGWTVITDKPLCDDAEAARSLVARDTGPTRRLFTLFNYTGYPAVREVRARIARGDVGRVVRVMIEMPQDSYMRLVHAGATDRIQPWRLSDGSSATVSLDLFVHVHSLARYLVGRRAVRVVARSRAVTGARPGLVDDVDALVDLEDGIALTAWYGKAALGESNGLRVRVYGDEGAIEWLQTRPEEVRVHDGRSRTTVLDRNSMDAEVTPDGRYDRFKPGHPSGFIEAFANSYADVADVLTGTGSDHVLDHDVAVEGLLLCEAISLSSSRDSAPVHLEERP